MFSAIDRTFVTGNQQDQVKKYACLSTDSKPTTGIRNGSSVIEMDTGKTYLFDEDGGEWVELPNSGGGGGGGGSGDFSTATVTIVNNSSGAVTIEMPFVEDFGEQSNISAGTSIFNGEQPSFSAVLYKGYGSLTIDTTGISISVSGGVHAWDEEEEGEYYIDGDGTVTVTDGLS